MNIGSNIKKLRRERDITQEQLAEYLNISVSAISQWECGKTTPDISLLAPLANILDVTSDVLLGIDITAKEKKIQDIISDATNYRPDDDEQSISILREGLKEYPSSFKIMERLMSHIGMAKYGKTPDEMLESTKEIIKLGEKILAECTDDHCRFSAINSLCRAYSDIEIGETEKAIELANKLPSWVYDRENLLVQLYKGEKKFKQKQENILIAFGNLIANMEHCGESVFAAEEESGENGNYTLEESIIIRKKTIKLIEVMIEDENYGIFFGPIMQFNYLALAVYYAKSDDYDKAIESLQLSSDYAIKTSTEYVGQSDKNYPLIYTSLLLKGTPNGRRFNSNINFSMQLLEKMKDTAFDPIREKKVFIEIEEKLKKYAENI